MLKFKNDGQLFSAWYNAQAWLRKHGYSCGSTCLSPYVAIQKGEYTLPQKVYNFDKEDMAVIDGVIYSLDYRNGEVEIWLKELPVIDSSERETADETPIVRIMSETAEEITFSIATTGKTAPVPESKFIPYK